MASLPRTLPANAYSSPAWLALENRAAFRKAWYLLGPIARFCNIGERIPYEFAGAKMFASRVSDAPGDINVEFEDGSRARSHLTSEAGLLFATPSSETEEFDDFFPGLKQLLSSVDFTQRPYRRSRCYNGDFNWKTMVDGYQECLHCEYTHPGFCEFYSPKFYEVLNHKNYSQHLVDPSKTDIKKDGLFLYFFPYCTIQVYGGGMSCFRFCPTENPVVTRMEFDYFHEQSGQVFEDYLKFVKQVAREDKELCEPAQTNINVGIYDTGILNPKKESGVIYYQQHLLKLMLQQHEEEKAAAASPGSDGTSSQPHVSGTSSVGGLDGTSLVSPTGA